MLVGSFIFLTAPGVVGVDILSNDISPWVWEQYRIHAARHGTTDALLLFPAGLTFYSAGFIISYCPLKFGLWLSGPVRKRAILIGQKAGQRFRFKVRPIFFQIFFTSHARNPFSSKSFCFF